MPRSYSIPKPRIKVPKGQIPYSVGEFSEESEANLKIDFCYYNDSECEIRFLHKKAKEALKKIKMIGQSRRSKLKSNNIYFSPVINAGAYKKLFSNLPDSFEDSVVEHKFSKSCRIFCSFEGDLCYIISIKANHIETKKHRK